MLAQKAKKAKASALAGKKSSLKDSFEKFSKSLTEEDFDNSVKIKNDLIENDGQTADDL
jgi:CTP synthase (UTP-ammonia lyase)